MTRIEEITRFAKGVGDESRIDRTLTRMWRNLNCSQPHFPSRRSAR
jgi:hypothetical protein